MHHVVSHGCMLCMLVCCRVGVIDGPVRAIKKPAAGGFRQLSGRACSTSRCRSCVQTPHACLICMCPQGHDAYTSLRATCWKGAVLGVDR